MAIYRKNGRIHNHPGKTAVAKQRRNKKSNERKRHNRQKHAEELATLPEDVKKAMADAEEEKRMEKELEERVKPETYKRMIKQARRWLGNEHRKWDCGGLTNRGTEDFWEWTRTPSESFPGPHGNWMEATGLAARQRFEGEKVAAQQKQGRIKGLEDWWKLVPSSGKRFRPVPGSRVMHFMEDFEKVGVIVALGTKLPHGQKFEKVGYSLEESNFPLRYFMAHGEVILPIGSEEDTGWMLKGEDDNEGEDIEDGGVTLPVDSGETQSTIGSGGLGQFDDVALPLRPKKKADEMKEAPGSVQISLPIRKGRQENHRGSIP
ncbi:MAG: hypothetical protein Q9181_007884 [Wetmoreana brouardii]